MKIYLAARYERRAFMRRVARQLEQLGHQVTSRWIRGNRRGTFEKDWAAYDLTDLTVADCIVAFTERPESSVPFASRGGRHVEFGYALKAGKRVVVVGPRENVFHHLPSVERFRNTNELLAALTAPAG